MRVFRFSAFILLLIVFAACDEPGAQSYENEVLQERLEKDMEMRDSDRSVLTREARERFTGLRYFSVDETYRFELELEREESPESVWMEQRVGDPIEHTRVGHIDVPFPEGTKRLSVFRPAGSSADDMYWLPFQDATTGERTYSAGRYLDIKYQGDGTVLADFNRAYNPLCEYNPEEYTCSLPPEQNELSIPVEAGEKKSHINM